ncbi:MAG: LamG-like jellyroll fold domain-containing protein, partial [bacterium]
MLPGNWYFLVSRYNGSDLSLWINGKQQASTGVSGTLQPQGNGNFTYIGSRSNTGDYFNGEIADAQIYNTSLSAQQIQQLYQEGIDGRPLPNAGLVGWWPLNGNANDYSGNGNNGQAISMIYSQVSIVKSSLLSSIADYGTQFDQFNNYITIPTSNFPTGSSPRTLIAWIKIPYYTSDGCGQEMAVGYGSGYCSGNYTGLGPDAGGYVSFAGCGDDYHSPLK